tara:strand:+ start:2555 stop:5695 length:3141 start_codon:yes stop_codon:yes gene_type:complete
MMKKIKSLVFGMLLGGYALTPVYAFQPSQAPILSTSAVTPNVLVLLDNSGSMNNAIMPAAATTSSFPDVIYRRDGDYYWATGGNLYPHDDFDRAGCSSNYFALYRYQNGSVTGRRCYRIPDPVGNDNTRFTGQYMSYIYYTYTGSSTDLRNVLPNDYRMNVARDVTKDIITNNRALRFGLFAFNSPTNNNSGPGGSVKREVRDLSASYTPLGATVTSSTQAQQNYTNLINEVDGLSASANTPLAETYYEMTRYMRGMSRYQGSGSGDYTSPIQYRCQRNFAIVVTDGLPTYDRSFPNDDPDRDNPQVSGGNNLPNWDGVNNDGNDLSGNSEGDTLYLDDMAKFAYDTDLRNTTNQDLAGKSFNDPSFMKQNMLTYTVGFAVQNEMLQDAADYGAGVYYTANDSAELTDRLNQAINEISAKAGSGGAGASSSATLSSDTVYYKSLYDPADWSGTIEAYRLNVATGRTESLLWTTDNTITPAANGASYQTFNTTSAQVVSLAYGSLSSAQQATLASQVSSPLTGASLVEWSKGAAVSGLRARTVLLGDIINSSLERVAGETQTIGAIEGDTSYNQYLAFKKANITPSLLFNGNDGFFHVVDAETGGHRYGYMPSTVLSKLGMLSDTDYAENGYHTFAVDGQIGISDAQLDSVWSTVAVGGQGAGGKSMFAVRLFQNTQLSPNTTQALWEVSAPAADTPSDTWNDLGYTYSRPAIARLPDNRWVAVFGNGYGSHKGKAALFVVDLATGALIRKMVVDDNTGGTAAEQAVGTGLSSPELVVNAQHQIERIYAGDTKGNMWRFDISSATVSNWTSQKLFAAGSTRPVTVKPLITEHPEGGYLVSFGTGKLSETADKTNLDLQAFYAIWDKPSASLPVPTSQLQEQSITGGARINDQDYFYTTTNPVSWASQRGWFMELIYGGVAEGERVIYPAQTTEGRVVFVTAKIDANDPCESSGSGRLVELDLFTGGMLNYEVLDTNGDGRINDDDQMVAGVNIGGGLPGLPVIIDKGEAKPTQTKVILLSTGQNVFIDERASESPGISRRIMWRQLQ